MTLNLDQKRYTFEESSFEKVNDKPVQIILSREALSNGDIDATCRESIRGTGTDRGEHYVSGNQDLSRKRLPVSHGDSHHQGSFDCCHKVSDCLHGNSRYRPKNGEIYFALEKYIPEVLELMTVIDSLGQESTIRVSPVVGDEVQKVVERAHDHFRTSVETLMRLTEEISDETHTKTLNTRLKDARDLLEQAAAYEIGLGMELEEVKAKIEAAKSRIAERLLGKTSDQESPSGANNPRTSAYLASSSGQLNLI